MFGVFSCVQTRVEHKERGAGSNKFEQKVTKHSSAKSGESGSPVRGSPLGSALACKKVEVSLPRSVGLVAARGLLFRCFGLNFS